MDGPLALVQNFYLTWNFFVRHTYLKMYESALQYMLKLCFILQVKRRGIDKLRWQGKVGRGIVQMSTGGR